MAQSQEKRNMSKPCTMRRWQRWLAIVAERRYSAITRYASAAERAGIRHAPLQSACRRYATTGAHPHACGNAHATPAATVGQQ